jgi:hypothetical protein
MRRIIDITSAQRIVVNVLDLLSYHFVRLKDFRVTCFLPQLMRLIRFVPQFIELKFLQQCFVAFFLHPFDDGRRGEGFELANAFG